MYTKKIIISIILFLSAAGNLFSEQILIGGPSGWNQIYSMETGISGPDEASWLQLADNEYGLTADTELLFHFNENIADLSGKYTVKRNLGVQISHGSSKKGSGSAVFSGEKNFLEIIPSETAAFAAGSGRLSDFSIEFWLNPARLSEGENIIRWSGAAEANGILQQEILCAISGRDLFWEFTNIFLTPELQPNSLKLKSSRSLIPKRWHHHLLRYQSDTGLLEYLIDGIPEDLTYTSRGGTEEQEIFYPYIGAAKASGFMIGRGFTGFIDELRITTSFAEPTLEKFSMNSGTAITEVLDLGYYDSRFLSLHAESTQTGQTQIYYYYRLSNDYFQPGSAFPRWNQFSAGEILPHSVTGRYIQIMAELFPDGTGVNSPRLSEMTIDYTKNLPPVPPAYISGLTGNGRIILNWQPVTDADIAGYKIYYGDKPGMYFGRDADAGSSPINAGNNLSYEIKGLENGKLYYFAVTSYDNAEIPHESSFSREISIRPSAIIRDE